MNKMMMMMKINKIKKIKKKINKNKVMMFKIIMIKIIKNKKMINMRRNMNKVINLKTDFQAELMTIGIFAKRGGELISL